MLETKKMENTLLRRLKNGHIDESELKSITASIAHMQKEGLLIDQILVKGKPRIDKVFIKGIINPESLERFGRFARIPGIRRLEGFPLGKPSIEALKLNIEYGIR